MVDDKAWLEITGLVTCLLGHSGKWLSWALCSPRGVNKIITFFAHFYITSTCLYLEDVSSIPLFFSKALHCHFGSFLLPQKTQVD